MTNKALEKWIAEHVMGWQWWRFSHKGSKSCQLIPPNEKWPVSKKAWHGVLCKCAIADIEDCTDLSDFKPTESKAAAITVLEKCAEKTFPTVFKSRQTEDWCVDDQTARGETKIIATADTLPLAICKFAYELFKP